MRAALRNLENAGLHGLVHVEKRELATAEVPRGAAGGLLATNPPYGERLGEEKALVALYAHLGEVLKTRFAGWRAAVFTGNEKLGMHLGLVPRRTNTLFNGAIECRLLQFELPVATAAAAALSAGAEMFANRLRKNLKTLGRWAQREGVDCYRLYDADLPEYAVAVDLYEGEGTRWAMSRNMRRRPRSISPKAEPVCVRRWRSSRRCWPFRRPSVILQGAATAEGEGAVREAGGSGALFHEVREGGHRFLVNFTDYLDTGLFLDHRPTAACSRPGRGEAFPQPLRLHRHRHASTRRAAVRRDHDGGHVVAPIWNGRGATWS